MQEVWRVRVADSSDQERVICVDGPAKAQGGVDPKRRQSHFCITIAELEECIHRVDISLVSTAGLQCVVNGDPEALGVVNRKMILLWLTLRAQGVTA